LNSQGNTDNVVGSVEQRTWVKKKHLPNVEVYNPDNEADEKYLKLESELEQLKESST
jgi:hypothetical protein